MRDFCVNSDNKQNRMIGYNGTQKQGIKRVLHKKLSNIAKFLMQKFA